MTERSLRRILLYENELRSWLSDCQLSADEIDDCLLTLYGQWVTRSSLLYSDSKIRRLLFKCTRQIALQLLGLSSDTNRISALQRAPVPPPVPRRSTQDDLLDVRSVEQFLEAMQDAPEQRRRVFTLRKVYGFSYAQIATHLGITVDAVEKHLVLVVLACAKRFK